MSRSRSEPSRFEMIILGTLAFVLIATTVSISLEFLDTGQHKQIVAELRAESEKIISSVQKWYHQQEDGQRSFKELDFEKLGYIDQIDFSKKVIINQAGRFTLIVGPKGETFDLLAESADGTMVVYRRVSGESLPEPEIH